MPPCLRGTHAKKDDKIKKPLWTLCNFIKINMQGFTDGNKQVSAAADL